VVRDIVHPAGGAVDPNDPSRTDRAKDAVMVGVRTTITYSAGATASFGTGREIMSTIVAATTQSAPAMKKAGR
jgi:hypothetical protein